MAIQVENTKGDHVDEAEDEVTIVPQSKYL